MKNCLIHNNFHRLTPTKNQYGVYRAKKIDYRVSKTMKDRLNLTLPLQLAGHFPTRN